jgi:copper(I)-binding protein
MVRAMSHPLRQRALHIAPAIALLAFIVVSSVLPRRTSADAPAVAEPTIQVVAAWIRWLPAGLPRAGYLTLSNTGDKALRLVAVSSPSYADVSIHRTVTHGDVEDMVSVKEITLEAHKMLEFETTGYHLMLMQPTASVDTSTRISITLRFSDGSALTVPFEVRRNAAVGSAATP